MHLELLLLCSIAFIYGGLWRRSLGGWLGIPRWILVSVETLILLSSYFILPTIYTTILTLCILWFWLDGHDFYPAKFNKLGYRYLAPAAVLAALTYNLLFIPLGLIVFCSYYLTEKFWNEDLKVGSFIDGHTSLAEIMAGSFVHCGLMYIILNEI